MTDDWIQSARSDFDLTESAHQASVLRLAETLLGQGDDFATVLARAGAADAPLESRMAALLCESRHWMLQNTEKPLKLAVIFAMWGEQNRLLPKSEENPTGEDSLATKLAQLDWLFRDTAIEWQLYAVDDGCPHGSGAIAQSIAADHALGDRVTVLFLSESLPAAAGPLKGLASADDSRKGGAVILGCMEALKSKVDAVVYTDADNSVHLGQCGLLLRPFVELGVPVVLGDRKHEKSVLVKDAARWGIGIKVLRHMQRMIGKAIYSRGILDTQAAFKLYERGLLEAIIAEPTVYDFSFDTDWILGAISRKAEIVQVPFAFIDSAAESASITQGPMTTWETLLFGLAKSIRRHGFATGDPAEMISVLEKEIRDYRDLETIIDLLPPELEKAGENDYGNPEIMSAEATGKWIREALGNRGPALGGSR